MTGLALVAVSVVASCSSPAPERRAVEDGASAPTSSTTPAIDDQADDPADDPDGSGPDSGPRSSPSAPLQDAESFAGPLLDDAELAARFADLGGQLAIGNRGTVAVARPDGGALQTLGPADEQAAQATWSRDGTALAWSSVSSARQAVLVQRFDDDGHPAGDPEVSDAEGFPVFYLQWDRDDRYLAFLRSSGLTGLVEVGLLEPGRPVQPIGQGAPLFVGWAPGSARLLAHVSEEVVELHDVTDGIDPAREPDVVLDPAGDFSAPVWFDDRRAIVVDNGSLGILTLADGTIEPIEPVGGPVAFVLSPDRRHLAYRPLPDLDDSTLEASLGAGAEPVAQDALVVLDLVSGERRVVTDEGAVAWEWSPDGSRLAWLSLGSGPQVSGQWHFWAVDGSTPGTDRTPEFALTRSYAESYLPFFTQYTQSVTGWAPDSSAFAYTGAVGRGRGVWIQLVDDPAPSQLVADGEVVTWGPGPTPEESVGVSAA